MALVHITNPLEQALADAADGRLDQDGVLDVLRASTVLLPQPPATDEGRSTDWQIFVFEGVCPAYTSLPQLQKALPPGFAYAEVPVSSAAKYWNPERPMVLNLGADLALEVPGPVVAGLAADGDQAA